MIIISLKNLFVKQNFKNTLIKEGHHVSKFGFYFSASICIAFENRIMMNLKFFFFISNFGDVHCIYFEL